MENSGDIVLAEKIAVGASTMVREYIAEMRRQGKIKGRLSVIVRDGKTRIPISFPEFKSESD